MPRLLDLFCGAGGCAVGYHRAGFDVVGVDISPQKRYPFEFHQGDALEFVAKHGHEFDAIHASPPCQKYCQIRKNLHPERSGHPDLVGPSRNLLMASGRPYVIENVVGAPMGPSILMCGSMFGLDVRRHRLFETSFYMMGLPCCHARQKPRFRSLDRRQKKLACVVGVHGSLNYAGELAIRRSAMGIDWMTNADLVQSIPPAYTQFIGHQLMAIVERGK